MSTFVKIRPVVADLFHADRQTDRRAGGQTEVMKPVFGFRDFAEVKVKVKVRVKCTL